MTIKIGFYLFPDMTQLDFAGPFEVFSQVPGVEVYLAAKTLKAVTADKGLGLMPTVTLEDCPDLDVLCVPGGPHVDYLFDDEATLAFLRRQGAQAQYVTSVCTGSLILGAAGLLRGFKATSHWTSVDMLSNFGAVPTAGRVVKDRNRITGGGVTAGIDFALTCVAEIVGERVAKMIQLGLEYNPEPPFDGGHPNVAEPEIVQAVGVLMKERLERRRGRAGAFAE
ncbi:DJ-1/PfpI family protein [Kordiimonas aestuarii]|uniref:DJ-1/PfpI family protein n=1 Tax=Kordiimonas aestuarii TaxID=1005925 RepID=UPI0021CFDDE7|nr:DJ-1/PfpI family protein [Kordiimonas aestuarii]